ncbi:hypothetical protein ACU637_27165, partial [Klebsiella aerogenes]
STSEIHHCCTLLFFRASFIPSVNAPEAAAFPELPKIEGNFRHMRLAAPLAACATFWYFSPVRSPPSPSGSPAR